jgi:GT2 family glycosyltransferase
MNRKLAIVICNWNKKDYVLKCVESVFASDFHDYDLIVVDNASMDGSAEAIAARFGDSLCLIANPENIGGSGGFNTGIREALKKDYRYICLLDNDVVIDAAALRKLVVYLD